MDLFSVPAWDKYRTIAMATKFAGPALSVASKVIFAIEFVIYTLYFYEEGFVLFLRFYSEALYWRRESEIMHNSWLNFDYMYKWYRGWLFQYGALAVYAYNAYATYCFMLLMFREYGNILMGRGILEYHVAHWFMWEGWVDD